MIAFARQTAQPHWHLTFLAMLPAIRRDARHAFHYYGAEAREEAVQEITANAFAAFARLVELGKTHVAHPTVLARYAILQYRAGRRVGGKPKACDLTANRHLVVERLDRFDEADGEWQEVLVEDKHAGPAETAAARIDIAAWFGSLGRKKRRIARTLAQGETTGKVAQMFGFSAGRVSQLRRELAESWSKF